MAKKSDKAKLIFLLLYFLILTVERVISLVTMFTGDMQGYDFLDWYMAALTVLSIIGAYSYMAARCRLTAPENGVFGRLSVAAGILLLGGMVHTEGTIPPIQFGAYGMILISMAIHTAQQVKAHRGGLIRWLSFGFIVAFSMSIPVVYHTNIDLAALFIPLEIIVSAGMVVMFTFMLRNFYNGDGAYDFPTVPFAFAAVGDAAVLALRWGEEINYFVLIFICIAAVLFAAGRAVKSLRN